MLDGPPDAARSRRRDRARALGPRLLPDRAAGGARAPQRTSEPVRVMMYSTVLHPAATVYPDSDKIGVWTGNSDDDAHLRALEQGGVFPRRGLRSGRAGQAGYGQRGRGSDPGRMLSGAPDRRRPRRTTRSGSASRASPTTRASRALDTRRSRRRARCWARASRRRRSRRSTASTSTRPSATTLGATPTSRSTRRSARSRSTRRRATRERCRVFAPMYRQITLQALFSGQPVDRGGAARSPTATCSPPGRPT